MIWARMLAYITGTVDQELLLRNEYLAAKNRILRAQIKGRLLLSDAEKATLAEIAHLSFAKTSRKTQAVDSPVGRPHSSLLMLNAIFRSIRFIILVLSGHQHVALENAALRQQLAICQRDRKRPRLRRWDRLFWIGLKAIWTDWKCALVIVRPETVISWQRKRVK